MKYFFILLILVFSHNSIAEEKKLEHFCKMNTKFYETDKNVSTRNEVKKLKKEIHSLKSNVEDIKTLLERVINGR